MTHIPKDPLILLSRRRLLGRLALGGTAALALAACGGGGSDGADDNAKDLKFVFYNLLTDGMTKEDVIKAVGSVPNVTESLFILRWEYGRQQLEVLFFSPNINRIQSANWTGEEGKNYGRGFTDTNGDK